MDSSIDLPSIDSAGGQGRRPEAAGGQLFFQEQPAVYLAGWDPMQRGKEADFFPGGQLASWRPAGLPNVKVALPLGVTQTPSAVRRYNVILQCNSVFLSKSIFNKQSSAGIKIAEVVCICSCQF